MDTLLRNIQSKKLADTIGFETKAAKEEWDILLHSWPRTTGQMASRAASFQRLQSVISSNPDYVSSTLHTFSTFAEKEEQTVDPLLRVETDVEKEGYGQVCFRGTPWSLLNTIPFALFVLSMYKRYFVPLFTILLPFLMAILPYFIASSMVPIRIPFDEYMKVVFKILTGSTDNLFPLSPSKQPTDIGIPPVTDSIKKLVQYASTLFTIGSSIWHPIQQSLHFSRLDDDCFRIGSAIVHLRNTGITWIRDGIWTPWIPSWWSRWLEECPVDPRQAFAFAVETPYWLRQALRGFGRLECMIRLAASPHLKPLHVVPAASATDGPILVLRNVKDPNIDHASAVASHFRSGVKGYAQHSILTGPNRGGKSSFLRSVAWAVVLGHTVGATWSENTCAMSRISWIANGLKLEDTPGTVSMFEREVAFAKSVFQERCGHGLVLYDECFHSTNPPDAIRTATLFCSRLWKDSRCISILSTHIYGLAASSPTDRVQRICVPSWRDANGAYIFRYKITPGICTLSSVDILLEQYGLLRRKNARVKRTLETRPPSQNESSER